MKPLSIDIVPAQPGFFAVYEFDNEKEIDVDIVEPIIAWRIETYQRKDSDELFSTCTPLNADGECGVNCIGVQNPDKTVTVFGGDGHDSIEELRNEKRYPKTEQF